MAKVMAGSDLILWHPICVNVFGRQKTPIAAQILLTATCQTQGSKARDKIVRRARCQTRMHKNNSRQNNALRHRPVRSTLRAMSPQESLTPSCI